jgi:four helix bundle protein
VGTASSFEELWIWQQARILVNHQFLDIAKGSCGEVRSTYYPAEDLGYVGEDIANERRTVVKQISAGIASLMSHLES